MTINVGGVYHSYQAVLKHMVDRAEAGDPGGRLACVSSLASVSGAARSEHYAASKGALNAMTFALAVEFALLFGPRFNMPLVQHDQNPVSSFCLSSDDMPDPTQKVFLILTGVSTGNTFEPFGHGEMGSLKSSVVDRPNRHDLCFQL